MSQEYEKIIWKIKERKFPDIIDQLLYNRGVIESSLDASKKENFFHPDFKGGLYDPFLMKNLERAVLRIKKAKDQGERIGIFADYDADGIPGAALLYRVLSQAGISSEVYIPNREVGYGLSQDGIDFLVKKKCSVIITVDLGIRNLSEAEYCKEIGLELIITDHHIPGEVLPNADLVINPKQKGDRYPFKDLCGCGVVFKLAQGLAKLIPEVSENFLKWNLDLVAISTISDVVPLIDENRILAKFGLVVIQKTRNLGMKELVKVAGLSNENLMAYHLGFQIGPRINAPGRVDHATKSFELLVTDDSAEAKDLALSLDHKNESRQKAMESTISQAISQIEENNLQKNKIIMVVGDWPKGVIGPSASRLVEKYQRPVIIFSEDDKKFTGSARSMPNVNIVSLFEELKEYIDRYGGHKGAAGISIIKKRMKDFSTALLNLSERKIKNDDLTRKIAVDMKTSLSEMTEALFEKLKLFEPLGMQNPKPIFIAESVFFENIRFVGKQSNHLSAICSEKASNSLKTIFFNFPYEKDTVKDGVPYDIVFNLNLDEWHGRRELALNICDLREHK